MSTFWIFVRKNHLIATDKYSSFANNKRGVNLDTQALKMMRIRVLSPIIAVMALAAVAVAANASKLPIESEHKPLGSDPFKLPTLESSDEPILVKTLSGATIKVNINLSYTVRDLKRKIHTMTGVPGEVQQLVFNRAMLKDDDQSLRDYKLEPNSIVLMVLFSNEVNNAEQIDALEKTTAEPTSGPYDAPIFREASLDENDGNSTLNVKSNTASLYADARNWIFAPMWPRDICDLFDPTICLPLTTSESSKLRMTSDEIDRRLRYGEHVEEDGPYLELRARGLINAIFLQHRKGFMRAERHGIRLGTNWRPEEPLIANINNYAPDNFTNEEILRLFEMSEKVRQQLASDAISGQGNLGLAQQRAINEEVMRAYLQAAARIPMAIVDKQPDELGLCAICQESLKLEPASKLAACGHSVHTDCLMEWVHDLKSEDKRARCPYCRKEFRPPYEGLKCSGLK